MASEMIERDLYNGLLHMVHNPNARGRAARYTVTQGETTTKPKGVTTILGKVIAKDLMKWAVSCCIEFLSEKLPVITEEDLEDAAHEYENRRDSGAGTGTEAHALVENFLKNNGVLVGGSSLEAMNAFNAFKKWYEKTKPEVVNVEEVIYSKEFEFAGTYDCMLKIDGRVWLCDLKTTNASRTAPQGVYPENFMQLGAYAYAHDEQREYEEKNGGSKLVPVEGLMVISCKKNGKLDIVTNEDLGLTLDDCKGMFKRVVNLFNFLNYVSNKLNSK